MENKPLLLLSLAVAFIVISFAAYYFMGFSLIHSFDMEKKYVALKDSINSNELIKPTTPNVGADEYGMKTYVMAFLKKGPNRNQDSTVAAKLQKLHMDNINRMAENGDLILAGPFIDDFDVRGIYIFNTSSIDSARKLTESDPAIKAGRLQMELHTWYGSAALMEINTLHKKYEKKSF